MKYLFLILLTSVFFLALPASVQAQKVTEERVQNIESRLNQLSQNIRDRAKSGIVLFLFGAFCALWAQNTNRNSWLWFFMGCFFSIFTVIVLLIKNANDNKDNRYKNCRI